MVNPIFSHLLSAHYVVRPKADQDLDDQAYYLATQANPEVGHSVYGRFA